MAEKYYIYGLVDPASLQIRYIGKTNDMAGRFKEHLRERGDTRKCKWVSELSSRGKTPSVVILEETDGLNALSMEAKWIGMAISFGWDLVNTKGVGDSYATTYSDALGKYQEVYEDRQNLQHPLLGANGASSYKPEYLLEKLKRNLYRPILQDGELVMLAKSKLAGFAVLVYVEDHGGYPYFRNTENYFSVPMSDLPLYVAASLGDYIDGSGANPKYYPYIITSHFRKSPDYYSRDIAEMEAASIPVTGRTFYAALG